MIYIFALFYATLLILLQLKWISCRHHTTGLLCFVFLVVCFLLFGFIVLKSSVNLCFLIVLKTSAFNVINMLRLKSEILLMFSVLSFSLFHFLCRSVG